jgi:hypothetical protein
LSELGEQITLADWVIGGKEAETTADPVVMQERRPLAETATLAELVLQTAKLVASMFAPLWSVAVAES